MKLIFALLFVVGLVEISLAGLPCPDNHWDLYGNSCYWFRPYIRKTWHRASQDCQSKGGNLVKISSSKEQAFITSKINSIRYKSDRWTGLHSSSTGGSFTWADDSSLGFYKNWDTEEPNYSGSACVAVSGKSDPVGKWYDDSCTSWKMYICEKPADVEVNECAENPGPCDINADCINTVGSYTCKCKQGFTGDGIKTCADVNECADPDRCHVNATCTNTVGLYTCECKPGFTGNGINCEDVDECAAEPGLCDINADCTNTVGSYTCECKPGFTGDGKTCEGGPVQWEPKGCYRDLKKKKKVFVKSFYAALVKKMSPPPIGDEDKGFKATFELCRKAAEEKKLDLDVIGIAIKGKGKKRRVLCMRTRDGQPPKSGNYGKDGKKACKVDTQGFGVGVRPRVNFVYIKAKTD